MKTQDSLARRPLFFVAAIAALGLSAAACSKDDEGKTDSADTTEQAGKQAGDKLPEPDFKQPRIGVDWCDKLLEYYECSAPRYKKREDRIEAAAVGKIRAKEWKAMPASEANVACKKKYDDGKEFAPEYENGLMTSCYKY